MLNFCGFEKWLPKAWKRGRVKVVDCYLVARYVSADALCTLDNAQTRAILLCLCECGMIVCTGIMPVPVRQFWGLGWFWKGWGWTKLVCISLEVNCHAAWGKARRFSRKVGLVMFLFMEVSLRNVSSSRHVRGCFQLLLYIYVVLLDWGCGIRGPFQTLHCVCLYCAKSRQQCVVTMPVHHSILDVHHVGTRGDVDCGTHLVSQCTYVIWFFILGLLAHTVFQQQQFLSCARRFVGDSRNESPVNGCGTTFWCFESFRNIYCTGHWAHVFLCMVRCLIRAVSTSASSSGKPSAILYVSNLSMRLTSIHAATHQTCHYPWRYRIGQAKLSGLSANFWSCHDVGNGNAFHIAYQYPFHTNQ